MGGSTGTAAMQLQCSGDSLSVKAAPKERRETPCAEASWPVCIPQHVPNSWPRMQAAKPSARAGKAFRVLLIEVWHCVLSLNLAYQIFRVTNVLQSRKLSFIKDVHERYLINSFEPFSSN